MLQRLAGRADVGSPSGYARLGDLCAADVARLSRAGKDLQLVLELAGLAEGVVVGVECSPALLDGPCKDVADRGVYGPYLLFAQGVRLSRWMNAGCEEDLVGVDVADAGDHRLVEEQSLDGGTALEGCRKVFGREVSGERVGAETGDQGVFIYRSWLVEVEVAKPEPGEGEHHPALELEDGGVDLVGLPPPVEAQDPPRDDQVNDPDHLPEVEECDLTPPPRPPQRQPYEPARELLGLDVGHVGPEDPRPQHLAPTGQSGHVLGYYGNLGELGHLVGSKQLFEIGSDPVFIHGRSYGICSLADLVCHPPYRDPVPNEAEHVHVIVGVAEGYRAGGVHTPPLAQERERL